jgi:hypothetical protein
MSHSCPLRPNSGHARRSFAAFRGALEILRSGDKTIDFGGMTLCTKNANYRTSPWKNRSGKSDQPEPKRTMMFGHCCTGDIPLGGQWSIDRLAGAAVFGERTGTFNSTTATTAAGVTTVTTNIGNSSDSPAIFNANAEVGLSYWFSPTMKITASYRYDEYFRALKTSLLIWAPAAS